MSGLDSVGFTFLRLDFVCVVFMGLLDGEVSLSSEAVCCVTLDLD